MEEKNSPKDIRKANREDTKKKLKEAIKSFEPEQVILIMGKHKIDNEGKRQYETRVLERLNPDVFGVFLKTMGMEIVKLKNFFAKEKKIIKPGEFEGGRLGRFLG